MVDTTQTSKTFFLFIRSKPLLRRILETLTVVNSELFLHTDNYLFGWRLINAEKQLHFDLESVLFRNELAL